MCFCAFMNAGNKIWENDKNRAKNAKNEHEKWKESKAGTGNAKLSKEVPQVWRNNKRKPLEEVEQVYIFGPSSSKVCQV